MVRALEYESESQIDFQLCHPSVQGVTWLLIFMLALPDLLLSRGSPKMMGVGDRLSK